MAAPGPLRAMKRDLKVQKNLISFMKGLGGGAGEAKSKAGFRAGRSPKSQLPLELRAPGICFQNTVSPKLT